MIDAHLRISPFVNRYFFINPIAKTLEQVKFDVICCRNALPVFPDVYEDFMYTVFNKVAITFDGYAEFKKLLGILEVKSFHPRLFAIFNLLPNISIIWMTLRDYISTIYKHSTG